jgi:drug/metabolite transporter (DMT)-like permease
MAVALLLALIGWAGIVYLVNEVHPTQPFRVAFLALWGIALVGTAWPVILALHRRFRGEPSPWTVWRQSTWLGIFGALAAWLQMNRDLNVATAAILAGVFVVLEVIMSLRARQETQDD